MRVAIFALIALNCADAAFAQDLPCSQLDGARRATKTFVENYNAATNALRNSDWTGAIGGAALANPHAQDGQQVSALQQIIVAAYDGLGDKASFRASMETALQNPCLNATFRKSYVEKLKAQ